VHCSGALYCAKEMTMRKFLLTMVAVSAAGVATLATLAPAAAYDYPWCVQGKGVGIPGDCSYQSYEQCLASASGRGLYCNSNPRAALNFQRPGRYRGYYDY
jgi:uncharacterized protein DUF3551